MTIHSCRIAVPIVFALTSVPSFGAIVNFSVLSQDGSDRNSQGTSYTQNGFKFTVAGGAYGQELAAWQRSSINHAVGGDAATSLTSYYAASTVTIALASGGLFDASSIDLAPWGDGQNPPPTFDVTLTGTKADNSTVQDTFTINNTTVGNPPVLQTKSFTGFSNLKKIELVQGFFSNAGTSWQFNNFNASPVPEPFTLGLAGCALAAGIARRRRRLS